jgi:hypothetical protein
MKMTLAEAKAECQRWLAYLDRERERSIALQKIASARRSGEIDDAEAQRRALRKRDSGLTVYDGANLEKAVKVLLTFVV